MKVHWEQIDEGGHAGVLWRAKIIGGWLIKHVNEVITPVNDGYGDKEGREGYEWRSSITFVPDPEHKWI